jgi:hypothetical protein
MVAADQQRKRRWLLVAALLAPATLSAWWFWRRPPEASPSQFEAALDRSLEPVLEQHAAEARLGMSSPRQVKRLARQLALDSVPYLAPADLELWASLRLELARSSRAACARLWQGADDAFLARAVAALGDEKLRAYSDMLARGLALRLERKPPAEPRPDAIQRAMAAVAATMSEPQRERFESDLTRKDLDDARACELFLLLSDGARKLEPEQRTELYRALGRQLRESSPPAPAELPR